MTWLAGWPSSWGDDDGDRVIEMWSLNRRNEIDVTNYNYGGKLLGSPETVLLDDCHIDP